MTIRTMTCSLMTAVFSCGIVLAAQAVEPMAPVQQQLFTCSPSQGNLSRVSTADVTPSNCCSPNSHCVEYLSTTTLDHASKANRLLPRQLHVERPNLALTSPQAATLA